jgi:hypothetical protein
MEGHLPQLTPSFFRQDVGESLAKLPRFDGGPRRIAFKHIVHAYIDRAVPKNTAVQAITFESIRLATELAKPAIPVACIGVTFPAESYLVPAHWSLVPRLERVVTDIANFAVPRPLPLLFDILELGITADTANPPLDEGDVQRFIIFTNSDIQLLPHFYLAVAELIRMGYDAISINRRVIDYDIEKSTSPAIMFSDFGEYHGGHDCFIFSESMFQKFAKNRACVGASMVMRALLFNMAAHAHRYLMLTAAHLTFHIGHDAAWTNPRLNDYGIFNFQEAMQVATTLATDRGRGQRLAGFMRANAESVAILRAVESQAGISREPKGRGWLRKLARRG